MTAEKHKKRFKNLMPPSVLCECGDNFDYTLGEHISCCTEVEKTTAKKGGDPTASPSSDMVSHVAGCNRTATMPVLSHTNTSTRSPEPPPALRKLSFNYPNPAGSGFALAG